MSGLPRWEATSIFWIWEDHPKPVVVSAHTLLGMLADAMAVVCLGHEPTGGWGEDDYMCLHDYMTT